MSIQNKRVFRYQVTITKFWKTDDGRMKTIELNGARGSDRQRQAIFFGLIKESLPKNLTWAYDGAASLFTMEHLESTIFHYDSTNIPEGADSIFRGSRGSLTISITLNTELHTGGILDQGACAVRYMMHIILMTYPRSTDTLTIAEGGKEAFEAGSRGRRGWIHVKPGVGAGIKIVKNRKGEDEVHVILDYKQTQFFTAGPRSDVIDKNMLFEDKDSATKFFKDLKMTTTYSNQPVTFHNFSREEISELTYTDKNTNEQKAVLEEGIRVAKGKRSDYNPKWPAVQTRPFKRGIYSFPIENLKMAPNQKLGPRHGNPPGCVAPRIRYQETRRVGESIGLLSTNPILQGFGIDIQSTPVTVQAVKVPIPGIQFQGAMVTPDITKQATWNISGKFIQPAKIPKILILYGSSEFSGKVEALEGPLKKTASGLGVTIGIISSVDLEQAYPDLSNAEAIDERMESLKALKEKPLVIHVDRNTQQTHALLKLKERQCQVITQQLDVDKALKKNSPTPIVREEYTDTSIDHP
uniref:Piwi domain-containing protein n=1 Tax=Caenorhabditis tropicalis TaxID=1561998 RepID=A0A1I7U4A0_9PELO